MGQLKQRSFFNTQVEDENQSTVFDEKLNGVATFYEFKNDGSNNCARRILF
jgi:hypothetical protein